MKGNKSCDCPEGCRGVVAMADDGLMLNLADPDPAKPDELTAVVVSIYRHPAGGTVLSVDVGDHNLMIGGGQRLRNIGIAAGEWLRVFLSFAVARTMLVKDPHAGFGEMLPLMDIRGETRTDTEVWCRGAGGDTELLVRREGGCIGFARGPVLRSFLAGVRALAYGVADGAETGLAGELTEADRELLRGMRIGEC